MVLRDMTKMVCHRFDGASRSTANAIPAVQTLSGKAPAGGVCGALRAIAIDRQDRLYAAGDSEVKVFDSQGGCCGAGARR